MQYPKNIKTDSNIASHKKLHIDTKVHLFRLFVDITALCFL